MFFTGHVHHYFLLRFFAILKLTRRAVVEKSSVKQMSLFSIRDLFILKQLSPSKTNKM
jgi:hypothetical protein